MYNCAPEQAYYFLMKKAPDNTKTGQNFRCAVSDAPKPCFFKGESTQKIRRYRTGLNWGTVLIRASLCTPPPLYLDSLFLKVQGPTPPSQRVGWTFRKVQGPNPPLLEGRLDFSKGPRSKTPLKQGSLEISKSPRSLGGGPPTSGGGGTK